MRAALAPAWAARLAAPRGGADGLQVMTRAASRSSARLTCRCAGSRASARSAWRRPHSSPARASGAVAQRFLRDLPRIHATCTSFPARRWSRVARPDGVARGRRAAPEAARAAGAPRPRADRVRRRRRRERVHARHGPGTAAPRAEPVGVARLLRRGRRARGALLGEAGAAADSIEGDLAWQPALDVRALAAGAGTERRPCGPCSRSSPPAAAPATTSRRRPTSTAISPTRSSGSTNCIRACATLASCLPTGWWSLSASTSSACAATPCASTPSRRAARAVVGAPRGRARPLQARAGRAVVRGALSADALLTRTGTSRHGRGTGARRAQRTRRALSARDAQGSSRPR